MTDARQKAMARKMLIKAKDYETVFSSPAGKRVLHDMMKTHHMMDSTFSKDPYEHALMEGERNVVIRILQRMKVSVPELEKLIDDTLKQEEEESHV